MTVSSEKLSLYIFLNFHYSFLCKIFTLKEVPVKVDSKVPEIISEILIR